MTTLTINNIEQFLSSIYSVSHKSQIEKQDDIIIDHVKIRLLSGMIPVKLNKVEVKESAVHGLGLFAKTNILKGELITLYPGDIIEFTPNGDRDQANHLVRRSCSLRSQEQFANIDESSINYDYAFTLDKFYSIIGNPYFINDSSYLGHFINDSSVCYHNEESIRDYLSNINTKNNCKFQILCGLHVAIVATKNINIGEELFISYGIKYWSMYNKTSS